MSIKITRKSFLRGAAAVAAVPSAVWAKTPRKWYKGNMHTHTLVSDGRAFPTESALLYRDAGYNFVVFTDHNLVHNKENWVTEKNHRRKRFSEKNAKNFAKKYPAFRPQTRVEPDGTTAWRYGTFEETAAAVNKPGEFIVMSGCEYNDSIANKHQLHCNVVNSFKAHKGARCTTMMESFKNMHDSFRNLTVGEDAFFVVNHPFYWFYDVDPLILSDIDELRFFEINNAAAADLPFKKLPEGAYDCDKLWDFALAKRAMRGAPPIYALGTDDTHYYGNLYREVAGKRSTYGNHAFVGVAADELSATGIVSAMRKGDFYASTGVEFADIRMDGATLSVEVSKALGKDCTIVFYGTKRDANLAYSPGEERSIADFAAELEPRKPIPAYIGTHRRIPKLPADAGIVLAETKGKKASYTLKSDDLYVRAKVISGEAVAWTQPLWHNVKK
ncbi:MAG: hypothetical protein J6R18_04105 [Kiritimatiellae bacterium]|nr:hypothetical protein [Kiritimatiellia bacterium]